MKEPIKFASFREYMEWTDRTAVYPLEYSDAYVGFKLFSEVGEMYGKVGKYLRGDYAGNEHRSEIDLLREHLLFEIGDVLWYLARTVRESVSEHRRDVTVRNMEPFWTEVVRHEPPVDKFHVMSACRNLLTRYFDVVMEHELMIWLSSFAATFGLTLKECGEANYEKLTDRQKRNVLKGSGDNR